MSLEQASFLAQVISAIAVAASLVFVGFQIHQNTQAMRTQTRQHIASSWFTLSELVVENPLTFASGLRSVEHDFADLPEAERIKFVAMLFPLFKHYENIFLEHKNGRVSKEMWAPWSMHMRIYFHQPGAQTFWAMRKEAYTASFRNYLESTEKPAPPSLADLAGKAGLVPGRLASTASA